MRATNPAVIIRDVWAENLDHELEKITQIIEDYPYVSMVLSSRSVRSARMWWVGNRIP